MPASLLYLSARPETAAADAEYASFRSALGTGLDRHGLIDAPLPEGVFERYRGIVVGGSPFNVTDPEPSDVQRRVEADLERVAAATIEHRVATMFTCYGIGVVTRMLGGTVTEHPEPPPTATVRATAAAVDDPLFGPAPARYAVFTTHKEGSSEPPPGGVLLATNEACPAQAYRVGTQLYATQFHPELSARAFADRITVYRTAGYFAPEDYERVHASVLAAEAPVPNGFLRRFAETFAG